MTRAALFLVAAGLLAAACGFEPTTFAFPRNTCASQSECDEGSSCVEGRCIASTDDALFLAFDMRVVDATGAELLHTYEHLAYTPDAETGVINLPEPLRRPDTYTVSGTVRLHSPSTFRIVPALVTFTPDVEGFRPPSPAVTAVAGSGTGVFEAELDSRLSYSVSIEPNAGAVEMGADANQDAPFEGFLGEPAVQVLPPIYGAIGPGGEGLGLGDGTSDRTLDIRYETDFREPCGPERPNNCTIDFQLVRAVGDGVFEPVAGAEIRAIDLDADRLEVGSPAVYDSESETYRIRVGPQPGNLRLKINYDAGSDDLVSPVLFGQPAAFFPGELPRILIPDVVPVVFEGIVRFDDGTEQGTVAAGATVRLSTAEIAGGFDGEYEVTVSADADGVFSARVPPGIYSIEIRPDLGTNAESWGVEGYEIERPTSGDVVAGFQATLRQGVEVVGGLSLPDGTPVTGVPGEFEPIALDGVVSPEGALAFSDEVGTYSVPVGRGCYDITFKLPAGSDYPWAQAFGVAVGSDFDPVDLPMVQPPVAVQGRAEDVDGSPLPGARIRAYRFVQAGRSPRPVLVGETVADELGAFELLVQGGAVTIDEECTGVTSVERLAPLFR